MVAHRLPVSPAGAQLTSGPHDEDDDVERRAVGGIYRRGAPTSSRWRQRQRGKRLLPVKRQPHVDRSVVGNACAGVPIRPGNIYLGKVWGQCDKGGHSPMTRASWSTISRVGGVSDSRYGGHSSWLLVRSRSFILLPCVECKKQLWWSVAIAYLRAFEEHEYLGRLCRDDEVSGWKRFGPGHWAIGDRHFRSGRVAHIGLSAPRPRGATGTCRPVPHSALA